jgi:hypothetical protein
MARRIESYNGFRREVEEERREGCYDLASRKFDSLTSAKLSDGPCSMDDGPTT